MALILDPAAHCVGQFEPLTAAPHVDLSIMEHHPWPECFSAAVSKILDEANIPNVLWGDLLYSWRGNRHIPQICGFVVPSEQLEAAVSAIERAGLASCNCKDFFHFSDPESRLWLPKHFRVAQEYGLQMTLFLCPSDTLLNLVPLVPSDPNLAVVKYDRYLIHLYSRLYPILPLPSCGEGQAPPDVHPDTYAVKALSTPSLIRVLILLQVFSPPERIGIVHPYFAILLLLALDGKEQGPYLLDSPSLQRLWDRWYVRCDRRECVKSKLWGDVRAEWKDRLSFLLPPTKQDDNDKRE